MPKLILTQEETDDFVWARICHMDSVLTSSIHHSLLAGTVLGVTPGGTFPPGYVNPVKFGHPVNGQNLAPWQALQHSIYRPFGQPAYVRPSKFEPHITVEYGADGKLFLTEAGRKLESMILEAAVRMCDNNHVDIQFGNFPNNQFHQEAQPSATSDSPAQKAQPNTVRTDGLFADFFFAPSYAAAANPPKKVDPSVQYSTNPLADLGATETILRFVQVLDNAWQQLTPQLPDPILKANRRAVESCLMNGPQAIRQELYAKLAKGFESFYQSRLSEDELHELAKNVLQWIEMSAEIVEKTCKQFVNFVTEHNVPISATKNVGILETNIRDLLWLGRLQHGARVNTILTICSAPIDAVGKAVDLLIEDWQSYSRSQIYHS